MNRIGHRARLRTPRPRTVALDRQQPVPQVPVIRLASWARRSGWIGRVQVVHEIPEFEARPEVEHEREYAYQGSASTTSTRRLHREALAVAKETYQYERG